MMDDCSEIKENQLYVLNALPTVCGRMPYWTDSASEMDFSKSHEGMKCGG